TLSLSLVNRLRLLPVSLGMALLPRAAGLEESEGARFSALVLRHALVWSGVAAALLGVAGAWLLPIVFGQPFAAAVAPFLLLLPTTAASTAFLVVARYFESVARQEINIAVQVAALVVNAGIGFMLSREYGANGAAVAALASNGVLCVLCLYALARACETSLTDVLTFRDGEGARYREALRALRRK
ncbi:MAG: polysaccharide biosynthesis C-terminal domain-containing protein, partial [Candidatus Binatia bacterium]